MSDIKYIHEHLSCFNYDCKDDALVNFIKLDKNNSNIQFKNTLRHKLFYIAKGECILTYRNNMENISGKSFFILPAGIEFKISTNSFVEICMMRLNDIENLCNNYSMDMLLEDCDNLKKDSCDLIHPIKSIDIFDSFFMLFWKVYNDGGKCRCFFEDKIKELQFLLRLYYKKEDLFNFYKPIISQNISFSSLILRNHMKVKTVTELAELANYSLSGFQKKFKKVFGVPAHNWMKHERMKHIYDDITNGNETFKEITHKYDFSSPSHFNDYCKLNFGYTPGTLRKSKIRVSVNDLQNQENL